MAVHSVVGRDVVQLVSRWPIAAARLPFVVAALVTPSAAFLAIAAVGALFAAVATTPTVTVAVFVAAIVVPADVALHW